MLLHGKKVGEHLHEYIPYCIISRYFEKGEEEGANVISCVEQRGCASVPAIERGT